jgi:hypothetical protein
MRSQRRVFELSLTDKENVYQARVESRTNRRRPRDVVRKDEELVGSVDDSQSVQFLEMWFCL